MHHASGVGRKVVRQMTVGWSRARVRVDRKIVSNRNRALVKNQVRLLRIQVEQDRNKMTNRMFNERLCRHHAQKIIGMKHTSEMQDLQQRKPHIRRLLFTDHQNG